VSYSSIPSLYVGTLLQYNLAKHVTSPWNRVNHPMTETKYNPATITTASSSTTQSLTSDAEKAPTKYLKWLDDDDDDEYARYIAQPQVFRVKQGYKWWLERTQQKNFPNLSKMALDILSIPAMSANPERLFSGAKITISDRRNRLGICVCVCVFI
jgi:hypothetical protein